MLFAIELRITKKFENCNNLSIKNNDKMKFDRENEVPFMNAKDSLGLG